MLPLPYQLCRLLFLCCVRHNFQISDNRVAASISILPPSPPPADQPAARHAAAPAPDGRWAQDLAQHCGMGLQIH